METKVWIVDNSNDLSLSYPQIAQAAALLMKNEVVAFPTETVYGLGANARSDEAVGKIYKAKGRPSDNPLIVHIATKEQLYEIAADVPEYVEKLIDVLWPGPITFVLPKRTGLSDRVTAGLNTVAVRMPDHPLALALIKEADLPIAAPSANLSGKPSPTRAAHVFDDLDGRIAGILDGGATGVGVESTVLDCTQRFPVILRPGGVTKEQLEELVGKVEVDQALIDEGHTPKSPGMKYTHYAPKAPLTIIDGSLSFFQEVIDSAKSEGKKVGVLATAEQAESYQADVVFICGSRRDMQSVAAGLYEVLRKFDEADVDCIYSESFTSEGVGQAVMNRLLKAAGHRIVKE
ncbi:L-threonylcarbamoyladenylate synthase [Metabacillus idriensis]|uniref:L-threonylcarbamoyladenylate synthase n=1 Tax=Metabacillus idriensis TaxID=324768 RepID=UPI00174B0803|nr:L-threonylcarbamoyladenylate synthase [Metabacillus idriensis]